jgi:chloramphenicol O-acetyltransferase type A
MRYIDMENWSRRDHFELFNTFDHPHFSICAHVDLTAFNPAIKQQGFKFTAALVYALVRTANDIPEFRYRVRGDRVIEHEVVHPSFVVLLEGDQFSFCTVEYDVDFNTFAERVAETIACVQENPTLTDEPGEDNQLYMTAIPWVSFISFNHPMNLHPETDSVPRFAWGKFFQDGDTLKMPLDVQGHHGLMDGIHMGRYFAQLQEYLDYPGQYMGES